MRVGVVEGVIGHKIEYLLFTDVLIEENIGLRVELLESCDITPSVGPHRSPDGTLIEKAFIDPFRGIEFPITSLWNATAHTFGEM